MSAAARKIFDPSELIREHCRVDDIDIGVYHRGSHWDYCALAQVFSERQYDVPGIFHEYAFRYHQKVLSSGKIPLVVDAGANIGAGSLWFTHKWHPCHVISVEPDPGNFAVLSENIKNRSIRASRAGIDWQDGQAILSDPGRGELGYQTITEGEGDPVRMVSLRTMLKGCEQVPFILKIDIEGAEASLFSADTGPAALFPIVMIEPHDWMMPGQKSSVPFLRWHAAHNREIAFGGENIFSFDMDRLSAL
jgi:FkbM family methyltransferase